MSAKKRARAYYRGTVQHWGTGPAQGPVAYIERAALLDRPYNGVLGWEYAPPVQPPKPRRLTTRQAWMRIAEAFEARASGGTHPDADTASLAGFDLGVAIFYLQAWGCITDAQARTMRATHGRTLDEQIRSETRTKSWRDDALNRTDAEIAGLRCMLATLFALEPGT